MPASSNGPATAPAPPPPPITAEPATPGAGWEYAPAPERFKLNLRDRYGLFIGGKFVEPRQGAAPSRRRASSRSATPASSAVRYFATTNPATEGTIALVAQGTDTDVNAAVVAARKALPLWQALHPTERAKFLFRIARRIQDRSRELAVVETMDGGKPIRESRDVDIPLAAAHFFYYAGWADKLPYAFPGRPAPGAVGVCGQIIPWNFPLLMAAWKLAPALACGNTCVLKPAETTPLTALLLAEICDEVGLPPGVVNVVTGDGSTGAALVAHRGVDKIAFTGSTDVGKRIAASVAAQSAESGAAKRLTLELGGKSANIIFEDASLDQAVEGIIQGIFFNQGHVCCAGSRLLVQESVLEPVIQKLRVRMASLRVGDPLDKNTDVGAINSRAQLDRIEACLHSGEQEGAALCWGGCSDAEAASNGLPLNGAPNLESKARLEHRRGLPAKGFWCRPCFFTGVQPSHSVAREEIFGPVLAVMSFRTPDEAISRANNTPYGLAAGVWTDKGSKIFEVARRLKAGVVWLNTYNRFDPSSPFGGFKESGFGREGGVHGLLPYLR
ncbi:MAG: aldehyde dehydrogenase family protein [Phycisphaerales bacterium]|nr:aldehyde dehydrogenase family protein [Phycisphaerales bacterium]